MLADNIPNWHREHYAEEYTDKEPVSRRGRKQRSEQQERKFQQALLKERRRLAREAKQNEWKATQKGWEEGRERWKNDPPPNLTSEPIIVSNYTKPKTRYRKPSPAARSEQLLVIATEIFGGRYYCVGDKDVEVSTEST